MRDLHLGGRRWRVTFPKSINGDERVGECDYDARTIRLKAGQSTPEMRWTFVHEVCHAAAGEWVKHLPKSVRQAVEDGDEEEALVEMLEKYLRSAHDQLGDLWP